MLMKEIKECLDKRRDILFSQIRKIIAVKMSVFPKLIIQVKCNFYQKPSKIFFVVMDKITLKFICKGKGTRINKTIFKKNNKVVGFSLSDFKMYWIVTEIMTVYH